MKVLERFTIKGRGDAVVIDALPEDLFVGMHVENEYADWVVTGIEMHAMPRSHTNGQPAGLLLRGSELPSDGHLTIIHDETYCRIHERHKIARALNKLAKDHAFDGDASRAYVVLSNAAGIIERGEYK